jgi:hypothetical protein
VILNEPWFFTAERICGETYGCAQRIFVLASTMCADIWFPVARLLRSLRPLRFDFWWRRFSSAPRLGTTSPSVAKDFPRGQRYQANLQYPRHQSDPGSATFQLCRNQGHYCLRCIWKWNLPGHEYKSHKVCYGTFAPHVLMFRWLQLFVRSCTEALQTNN